MGFSLHQTLTDLCCNAVWKYAVFWKLTHRARMVLTWEDGYYGNTVNQEKKWLSNSAENLMNCHKYSHDALGLAVAKMSYHVYSLGEGIVGQVAVTGKHLWISTDKWAVNPSSSFQYGDDRWQPQFSAGVKTIVVVAVGPLGVVQLGSLEDIPEDMKMINHIRHVFSEVHNSIGGSHLQGSIQQYNVEPSCMSDVSTRTSSNYLNCINNHQDRSTERGTNMLSSKYASLGQGTHTHHSRSGSYPSTYTNIKNLEVPNKSEGNPGAPISGSFIMGHKSEGQVQEAISTVSKLEAINLRESFLEDNNKTLKYDASDPNASLLSLPVLPSAGLHKDLYKNSFHSNEMDTNQTPLSCYYAGCELYEALGPAFQKGRTANLWESENAETGDSSLLLSESKTDQLLEAVVGNLSCWQESGARSVEKAEPCSSDKGTISSAVYSSNSSGAYLERQQETIRRMSKRRAKPGESCRPRPRDRQLIQERIKELRDLVPNGSKCSIDSLLERAIKHVLYMQSVTEHDEMLDKCTASKWLLEKESVTHTGSSCKEEQGSSWAVEVGSSNLRVCHIMVENLNTNGHMLVEMLLKDCSHFLEIAEAIRSLELTILKGLAQSYGEKTLMRFVVEGQENQIIHRMDVLWSLMQLLPTDVNV